MKSKKILTGLLVASSILPAVAQKVDNTDSPIGKLVTRKAYSFSEPQIKEKTNSFRFRTDFGVSGDKVASGEIGFEKGLNKTWIGPYAKFRFSGLTDSNTEIDTIRNNVYGDIYTESIENVTQNSNLEIPFEAGVKLNQRYKALEAGVGIGCQFVKSNKEKRISGIDRTLLNQTLIQEKPFSLPIEKSSDKYYSPVISGELKVYPQKNIYIGLQGSYSLRDKRKEIEAKIGFTFGGKK